MRHEGCWDYMNIYAAKQNAKNAYDIARKELFRDYELINESPSARRVVAPSKGIRARLACRIY